VLPLAAVSPLWGIAVALIGAAATLGAHAFVRLRESRDRRRTEYGNAFAAALGWAELPYRVARRLSNDPDACRPLIDALHDAQREILFHRGWLNTVSSEIAEAYDALVTAIKEQTAPHLQASWQREPTTPSAAAELGAVYAIDVSVEQQAFIDAVRRDLSFLERVRRRRRQGTPQSAR
jgi:hypothetical protein